MAKNSIVTVTSLDAITFEQAEAISPVVAQAWLDHKEIVKEQKKAAFAKALHAAIQARKAVANA